LVTRILLLSRLLLLLTLLLLTLLLRIIAVSFLPSRRPLFGGEDVAQFGVRAVLPNPPIHALSNIGNRLAGSPTIAALARV
jgi:hypothetical protein